MRSLGKTIAAVAAIMLLLPSCDLLEGIYDEPMEQTEGDNSGFTDEDEDEYSAEQDTTIVNPDTTSVEPTYEERVELFAGYHRGEFTLDCSSYTVWNYLNFHTTNHEPTCKISNIDIATQQEDTTYTKWDVAMHRYDVKTNGGQVLETQYASLDDLVASSVLPEGTWVADTMSQVTIDMSHMLEGYLVYQQTTKNLEAGKWLDVDTSTMPPIYTLSQKVYLIRFSDGTYLAWYLKNYMNAKSVKGYMNVEYVYPIFETKQVRVN